MSEVIPNIGEEVVHNGARYTVVNRRAKVGEKVIVVEDFCFGKRGEIHEIIEVSAELIAYITDRAKLMNYDRCHVLEPIESTSPQSDRDLIIELAYSYAKLARKVETLEDDLQNVKHDAGQALADAATADEKAEMLIDDVVMLDERTQPLTDDGAKEFAVGLSDVIEEYVNDRMNSEQLTKEQIRRVYA